MRECIFQQSTLLKCSETLRSGEAVDEGSTRPPAETTPLGSYANPTNKEPKALVLRQKLGVLKRTGLKQWPTNSCKVLRKKRLRTLSPGHFKCRLPEEERKLRVEPGTVARGIVVAASIKREGLNGKESTVGPGDGKQASSPTGVAEEMFAGEERILETIE